MEFSVFSSKTIPEPLSRQIKRLSSLCWPGVEEDYDAPALREYASHIRVLLLTEGQNLLSCLEVPEANLFRQGESWRTAGLGAVMTEPSLRGKGYGTLLIRQAYALMQKEGFDGSIFTCEPGLAPFYTRGGWEHTPKTILIGGSSEHPMRGDELGVTTMQAFFSKRAKRNRANLLKDEVWLKIGDKIMW